MEQRTHRLGGDIGQRNGSFAMRAFGAEASDNPIGPAATRAVVDMVCVIERHEASRCGLTIKGGMSNMHRHCLSLLSFESV